MSWLNRIEKATAQFVDSVFTKLTGVESPHPGLQLRMTHGLPPNALFPFNKKITVGRDDDNDITLNDPSVSRRHATVECDATGALLHDLDSTNGTFVNDIRITTHHIAPGDHVRFGKTELLVETQPQPEIE